jgi:hypothetical protein
MLYLLRALCDGASFSSVFNFRFTPPWADETAHVVAHLDNVDVDVDVLGGAPKNPGLCVVESADNIDDIIEWIDKDTASALLIPGVLFGPDVMLRCRSSPSNETILLMGKFKSYTTGNKASLATETTAEALTSLHPNHWFEQAVCYLVSFVVLISLKILSSCPINVRNSSMPLRNTMSSDLSEATHCLPT